ncbi:MAG: VOC family protein [Phycisphaerales bacterium]|nr:VOC family protein [Phycisphaerales bacterium]
MSTPLPITGVAEIVLSVRDLPRMRQFYMDVLGFPVLGQSCHERGPDADPDGEPTIAFLIIAPADTPLGRNNHPTLLVLIDYRRHVFARPRFDGHDVRRSTLNHLAFEISLEDYAAHRDRLAALGLDPQTTTFPAMTARALFFKDPEGNQLELICHDPAAAAESA